MTIRSIQFALLALLWVALPGLFHSPAWGASSVLDVDLERLVARADLRYAKPPSRIEEGLPVGNGRMGTLLWTTTTTLKMQINRVDVFGCNRATTSFPERHTDTCGGCGFVDITFDDPGRGVFAGDRAPQHLACYDGLATIEGAGVKTRTLASSRSDVIATRITDAPNSRRSITAKLRMLRPPLVKTLNHTAALKLEYRQNAIILTQRFEEGDYYCASAVAVGMTGRGAIARMNGEREAELRAEPGQAPLTVLVASAASFDRGEDVAAAALDRLKTAGAAGFDRLYQANRQWWAAFWSKAFVHLHSADGVADEMEANYNYYLYVMASCSRGQFPVKFNGMLWTNDGDHRAWGAQYWGANQSCLYNALFTANRLELLDPMFSMYTGMVDSLALAARQQWGSQGIYIPETLAFDGLAPLPDDIAREMRDLYLLKKPWSEASAQFREYANNRPPHSSRWNWKSGGTWVDGKWVTGERGGGPYGPVSHIFSRGAKIAYQYWLRYEYTGDTAWLRERAWPMLKGVAEFYRNYPNLRKESDGQVHLYYVNSNEPLWGGRDTDEEIASLRAILPVTIKASEILDVDREMRPLWQELLDRLAPLPTSDMAATTATMSLKRYPAPGPSARSPRVGQRGTSQSLRRASGPYWIKGLPPIVQGRGGSLPDGNTAPMWFFDLCNLEADPALLKIANATYDAYFPNGVGERTHLGVLSKMAGVAALLGRAEDVRYLIPGQLRVTEGPALANRMTLKEGAGTTCNEQAGRAADALHLALCQSVPAAPGREPVIRVFPAWPRAWDADFTLLCRGGFLVTSSIGNGRIGFVEVVSQFAGPCRMRNPWGDHAWVTLFRNGREAESLQGSLLAFETAKGEVVVVVPQGVAPPAKHPIAFERP